MEPTIIVLGLLGLIALALFRQAPPPPTVIYVASGVDHSGESGGCLVLLAVAILALVLLGGLVPA